MRLHIGKAFKSLKLTDYLEEEELDKLTSKKYKRNCNSSCMQHLNFKCHW